MGYLVLLAALVLAGCTQNMVGADMGGGPPCPPEDSCSCIPDSCEPLPPPEPLPPEWWSPEALTITSITPGLASSLGHEMITIKGTFFDTKTAVFFSGILSEIVSISPTEMVVFTPAGLPWGVPITVYIRRATDGSRATNSNAPSSPSAFRAYASVIDFRDGGPRYNQLGSPSARVALVGDLNKDGSPDLIATYFGTGRHDVFIGRGGGLLWTGAPDNLPSKLVVSKGALADLDGDGNLDMLLSDGMGTWQYNLGDGAGSLVQRGHASYNAGCAGAQAPVALRVNGDAYPDVAVACTGGNVVRVWLSQYNGANPAVVFGAANAASQLALAAPSGPAHLLAADLNRDGKQDLVVVSGGNGAATLSWYLGDGAALPAAPTANAGTNDQGQGPMFGACADVSGDAYPDCLVSDAGTGTVRVFLNDGAGALKGPTAVIPLGFEPREIALEDINGDGRLDLLVASKLGTLWRVVPGRGDGSFGDVKDAGGRLLFAAVSIGVADCRSGWGVQAADLDGDGVKEVVTSCEESGAGAASGGGFRGFKNLSR